MVFNLLGLTQTMGAVHGLLIHSRIPVTVVENNLQTVTVMSVSVKNDVQYVHARQKGTYITLGKVTSEEM